jgi:hypothetical protein
MPESSVVHIAITPHVIQPNGFVTLKLTYSGIGHCDAAQSDCTGGLAEAGLVRVDCSTHKVLRVQSIAVQNEHTQCYTLPPSSAPTAPFYAVIEGLEGNCSAVNDVADCVSGDYVLVEPPCGGASASVADSSNSAQTPSPAPIAAEGVLSGDCPLYMRITEGDTGKQSPFDMKSGVSFLPGEVNQIGFKKPADFQNGATFKGQCVSGCTDLLVTVSLQGQLNNAGQVAGLGAGLAGAEVTAKVVGLSSPDEIVNTHAGDGDLCTAPSFGSESAAGGLVCGQAVKAETDSSGQVRLRYWGPASWQGSTPDGNPAPPPEAHIQIRAVAHDCTSSSCQTQSSGPVYATINIQPHVIYQHTAVLTDVELGALIQWYDSGRISSGVQALAKELSKLKVFNKLKAIDYLSRGSKDLKQADLVSDVVILGLFENKFGLVDTGLTNYDFSQMESDALSLIKNPAASFLATKLSEHLFGSSDLFEDQLLATLKKYAGRGPGGLSGNPSERHIIHLLTLKVYESSFCSVLDCPPGSLPTAFVEGNGVHYNLFFAFSSTDKVAPGTDLFFDDFTVDTNYEAPTWVPAQCTSPAKCSDVPPSS